jgi:predicted GNAT family N-acyltransferase
MEPLYKLIDSDVHSLARSDAKLVFSVTADQKDIKEIGRLRHRVWTGEGIYVPDFEGSESGCWLDELDAYSTHFIVKSENKIIAAARLSFHAQAISVPDYEWLTPMHSVLIEPCVSLNRLVVDSEFRGRGIARKLDCIRLNHADKKLAKTAVVIGVGYSRVKALEALGFKLSHYLPEGNGLMQPEHPLGALYLSL